MSWFFINLCLKWSNSKLNLRCIIFLHVACLEFQEKVNKYDTVYNLSKSMIKKPMDKSFFGLYNLSKVLSKTKW